MGKPKIEPVVFKRHTIVEAYSIPEPGEVEQQNGYKIIEPTFTKIVVDSINENWDQEIRALGDYFSNTTLPKTVRLNSCSIILNVKEMINSHFATISGNSGDRIKRLFIDRLLELKQVLNETSKIC